MASPRWREAGPTVTTPRPPPKDGESPRSARGVLPRLASLLLELDVCPGLEVGPMETRLAQKRLAEMVACCREAVAPELVSLRREGVLG